MKVAVFDVCDTLYASNTSFEFLDYYFADNTRYIQFRKFSKSLPGKLLNYPLYRVLKYDGVKIFATSFLKGENIHQVDLAAKEFVYKQLKSKINENVMQLLVKYKEKGFTIILMSGSYKFIVKNIADYFEVHDFYASELESLDEQYNGKYTVDQLFTKKEQLQNEYANIEELVVVSDNKTDYELLKMADKAYVVCNKAKDKNFWLRKLPPSSDVRYLEMYSD